MPESKKLSWTCPKCGKKWPANIRSCLACDRCVTDNVPLLPPVRVKITVPGMEVPDVQ